MLNKNILIFLTLVIQLFSISNSSAYSIKDLKTLADSKSYKEAYSHLKDISPSDRTKEWNTICKKVILGYAKQLEKKSPMSAWELLNEVDEDYNFLQEDAEIIKSRSQTGLLVYEKEKFNSFQEEDEFVDKLFQIDQSIMYPLVIDHRFNDYKHRFITYLLKNKSQYKNDKKVHEYLAIQESKADHVTSAWIQKARPGLQALIKEYHLESRVKELKKSDETTMKENQYNKTPSLRSVESKATTPQTSEAYKLSMGAILGDFATKSNLHVSKLYKDFLNGVKFDAEIIARVAVSDLIYQSSSNREYINILEKLSRASISKAESELISVVQDSRAWPLISGSPNEVQTAYNDLEKFAPNILELMWKDFEIYKKNPNSDTSAKLKYLRHSGEREFKVLEIGISLPLYRAIVKNDKSTVIKLLKNPRVVINLCNLIDSEEDALDLAKSKGYKDIVEILDKDKRSKDKRIFC